MKRLHGYNALVSEWVLFYFICRALSVSMCVGLGGMTKMNVDDDDNKVTDSDWVRATHYRLSKVIACVFDSHKMIKKNEWSFNFPCEKIWSLSKVHKQLVCCRNFAFKFFGLMSIWPETTNFHTHTHTPLLRLLTTFLFALCRRHVKYFHYQYQFYLIQTAIVPFWMCVSVWLVD